MSIEKFLTIILRVFSFLINFYFFKGSNYGLEGWVEIFEKALYTPLS